MLPTLYTFCLVVNGILLILKFQVQAMRAKKQTTVRLSQHKPMELQDSSVRLIQMISSVKDLYRLDADTKTCLYMRQGR